MGARGEECEWDRSAISAAAYGNLEMVKYCVANECPIDGDACGLAADGGHLEPKYLHEEVKALAMQYCRWGGSKWSSSAMLEYLVEREYDEYNECACSGQPYSAAWTVEILAKLSQSAVELFGRSICAREQSTRMFTIPSRQQLSSPTRRRYECGELFIRGQE